MVNGLSIKIRTIGVVLKKSMQESLAFSVRAVNYVMINNKNHDD